VVTKAGDQLLDQLPAAWSSDRARHQPADQRRRLGRVRGTHSLGPAAVRATTTRSSCGYQIRAERPAGQPSCARWSSSCDPASGSP